MKTIIIDAEDNFVIATIEKKLNMSVGDIYETVSEEETSEVYTYDVIRTNFKFYLKTETMVFAVYVKKAYIRRDYEPIYEFMS